MQIYLKESNCEWINLVILQLQIKKQILMIVIADCGGTKGDWVIADGGVCLHRMKTGGINPFSLSEDDILARMKEFAVACRNVLSTAHSLDICFYGAGCNAVGTVKIESLLSKAFMPFSVPLHLSVSSDLLGAARALCGVSEGIACILGTGSNSCLYDGREITDNTPPLGYILGDEGSGADLGKHFLHALLKGRLSASLREEFYDVYATSYSRILQRVYAGAGANSYMAGIAPFILGHIEDADIAEMVQSRFRSFFRYNIARYHRPDLAVGFVGGIASGFYSQLVQAAHDEGFEIGDVRQSPMKGLLSYYGVDGGCFL